MSKELFRELAQKTNGIVEIPDQFMWVADDGHWGVGELLIVDASKWTDSDYAKIYHTTDFERWETALKIAEETK
jgi:hypothetical protein